MTLKGVIIIGIFSIFKRKKTENRAESDNILTFFGLPSGVLTREAAMSIPTVSACVNKIADTVARLPVRLYQKSGDEVTEISDDSRLTLLNGETGDTLNTVELWKMAIEDYFLGQGAWIFVNSDFARVKSLHYVDSRNISIMKNCDPIFKAFDVSVNGKKYYDFQFIKLLRKTRDGCTNIPIQAESAAILSAAYNALKLENYMSKNGGNKPGFLKSKVRLSDEAIAKVKEGYAKVFSNEESGNVAILNDGMEFQPTTATSAELQLNENKKVNSIEICKLFGFPHTVIDGNAGTDDNNKFIAAVVSLLNQIETVLDSVLLLETEKEQGLYFAFDTKELTRGSVKERYEAYDIAVRNNILQIDEIRKEEDYKPLGFNYIKLGLSDVLYDPRTDKVFTPNTGLTTDLKTGENRSADIELRYNHNHDSKGKFITGGGGAFHGGNVGKSIDKSGESVIIESKQFDPLSDHKVVPVMRETADKWIKQLSDKEIISIQKYTKNSGDPKDDKFYDRLNSALRGERTLDDNLKYHSDNISKAISKFKLTDDIICYRSTSKNYFEKYGVGQTFKPNYFLSSAVVKKGALKSDFTTIIQVPKGSKGAYIEQLSKYPKQREFLFDKSCSFKVLEKSKNNMRIEVVVE